MKLKLTELTERITPLPWKTTGSLIFFQKNPGGRKTYIADSSMDPGANQTIANAAYLVHSANVLPKLVEALEAIALCGGNLPDDRLTDRTGPNDAAARGIMYCNARTTARQALTLAREVEI